MNDSIIQKKNRIVFSVLRNGLRLLLLAALLALFLFGIRKTSDASLSRQQGNLENAIRSSAVHSYALHGRYPASLDEILTDYHITFDSSRFIVEYIPAMANLMPEIAVIPIKH